ncbi:hypothetical protein [Flavobacterium tructae]|uniref:hypothetical protein n=1 Tax=Flavobacterium tructae TaxID=1114873 RepID=UPI0035A864BD
MKRLDFFYVFAFLIILANLAYFLFMRPSSEFSSKMETIFNSTSIRGAHKVNSSNKYFTKSESDTKNTNSLYSTKKKQVDTVSNLQTKTLKLIYDNATPAAVTTIGHKSYLYLHKDQLKNHTEILMNYGVKKEIAENTAKKITKFIGKKIFKRISVLITASGASYVTVQFFDDSLSLLEKVSLAISGGLILTLIYLKLTKNIMR